MDDGPVRYYLIAYFILIFVGGFFSGSEIAFSSLNKIRVSTQADDGDRGAKRVMYILDNFDKALSTLLIGTNIVHTVMATIATLVTYKLFADAETMPDYAITVSTLITTVLVFFLSEMIPKCFAKDCNVKFARISAPIIIFLMKVLTPLSFLFDTLSAFVSRPFKKRATEIPTVTEDELYELIETYVEENDIDEDTEELVQNVIEFSESTVEEVMTPWENVISIDINMPAKEVADIINGSPYSRFPVTKDGNVVGTLRLRTFLRKFIKNENIKVSDVMSQPEFIPDSTAVDDLLNALSSKRTHIAYVKNAEKVIGIITVEDILEELVGEIYDEQDAEGGEIDD